MLSLLTDLRGDLDHVEGIMADATRSVEPRVTALLCDLGSYHGKMLRPSLQLLVARTLGEPGEDHFRLGAALEMIHAATLVHDDMIDDGEMRRGRPTPHLRFGNSVAVLLGDFFYTRAFDLVAALQDPWVTKTLTATTNVICEGELHQMCARRDSDLREDEYYRIIYAKTAVLCETACVLGMRGASAAMRTAAADFGRECGLAFQIVDDCLDLSADPQKVGKTLATDIEGGRLTLPLIRLLAQAGAGERPALAARLLSVNGPAEVETVRRLAHDRGAVASALATANNHIDRARTALRVLPPGPARDQLDHLAGFIVAREF